MKIYQNFEVWFATGSQHLYGPKTLEQVAKDSQEIVNGLNKSQNIPIKIVFKPILTTPDAIYDLMLEANNAKQCIGLMTWMHTFSPAKMWIAGLKILSKPFMHLHTQFNRDIPWSEIDMDFMNLNQSAHGDREFGFICTRLGINRKVVVGFWQETKMFRKKLLFGCGLLPVGRICVRVKLHGLAIICGKWLLPKVIKLKRR